MKSEQKNSTRVQLELPDQSFERLKRLKDKTEAASYAEVMKNALRFYEALILEADAGNEIFVQQKSGDKLILKPVF
jgi:hypothetical protein